MSLQKLVVFSTYVEVILLSYQHQRYHKCFLHVCGGDPWVSFISCKNARFSPRMWRWSWHSKEHLTKDCVFSTYVEVILKFISMFGTRKRFLHVCGGDPGSSGIIESHSLVFSTYVEVIHKLKKFTKLLHMFSPRMWRWSSLDGQKAKVKIVFSTYVEVILF